MKKLQQASFTVEASFLIPLSMMVFVAAVYLTFYFHDQSVLSGIVYETAVVGVERKGYTKEELDIYFQNRMRGKCILFSDVEAKIAVDAKEISVTGEGVHGRMKIQSRCQMGKIWPEKYIRNRKKIVGER